MSIIENLHNYTVETPNSAILFDEVHTRGITYHQLDDMSGKVYGWLKKQEIGKEDFVLIKLPRGVLPVIAMVGVWKAGAAWVLVEDTYAPDRIEYIRNNCGCKAEISAENWDEIMACPYLEGCEVADDHDAAFAVYTSGTTGNPKGVLHEYGNVRRIVDTILVDGQDPILPSDRIAILSPLNFVASVMVIVKSLSVHGIKLFIVSYSTLKSPSLFAKFFIGKRISVTFLTPSYVRKMGKSISPFLRILFVGSEPANNTYVEKIELINSYSASEIGFMAFSFRVDKPYETCPIGKQVSGVEYALLADRLEDDGEFSPRLSDTERTLSNGMTVREVARGEVGELCILNPFVRGYIDLPEESAKAFENRLYHTNDLARVDENGNVILLGRNGDMIKINGNRIEPAEIESAIKNALGIKWCAAKGVEKDDKSFLCAYYNEDVEFDPNKLREELLMRLPYYMIPSYFIKVDNIPLRPSGKLDRKALPDPDLSDYQENYREPQTETQKAICEAMAKVLKLGRVGLDDDFYEIGGDSLTSIEMISTCTLEGLSTSMIFRGRTPEKIAMLYESQLETENGESADEINAESMKHEHPLTPEQLYMIDYQLYTPYSTMYNLYSVIRIDKEVISAEQIVEAMEETIKNHPALLTSYGYTELGDMIQKYTPELFQTILIERLSEFEFNYVKDTLVYPFKIIGGRLYRCKVFETEKAEYLFFDVHHSVFDGTSYKVFMGDIGKALMGEELERDYYYMMLANREKIAADPFYEEGRKYFEGMYGGCNWTGYPKIDHESRDNKMGELIAPLDILPPQMRAMEKAYRISRNEFFITVAILAIAFYNDEKDIKISWIYNGREDIQLMNTVGLLFRDLPVAIHLKGDDTLRDIFAQVHEQVNKGIEYSCYPYVDLHNRVHYAESAYLLYQQDIRDLSGNGIVDMETVDVRQNQAASQTILDMEILDGADGLGLMIDFAASRYREESMHRFQNLFICLAQSMVTHASQTDVTVSELREKISDKKSFFNVIKGFIRWKR